MSKIKRYVVGQLVDPQFRADNNILDHAEMVFYNAHLEYVADLQRRLEEEQKWCGEEIRKGIQKDFDLATIRRDNFTLKAQLAAAEERAQKAEERCRVLEGTIMAEREYAAGGEPDERDAGCLCQGCGKRYKVDFLIPDDLWDRIRPGGKPKGCGLLCGHCIINRLEALGFGAFSLIDV